MRRIAIALAVGFLLLAVLAFLALRWVEVQARASLVRQDVVFEVPKGVSGARIPKLLVEAKLLGDPRPAQLWLKLHPTLPMPKFGKHQLKQGMSLADVLAALAESPLPDDVPVTVLEGWRIIDTDKALATASPALLPPGAYAKVAFDPARFRLPFPLTAPTLEGYLYPETYLMPAAGLDPELLIVRQVASFHERFSKPYAEEIAKSGRTLHDLVIVASMLEREEPKPENRPTIAGIIYKRLERRFPLGIDATSRYGLEDWNDRAKFLPRLRDAEDPYNTRLRTGLPAGPIGSPTVNSLLAALRPASSDFLYYLHDKDRNLHLARDAAEHEANRRRYDVY